MKVITHHDERKKFCFVLLLSSSDSGANQTLSDSFSVFESKLGLKRTAHGVGALNDLGESFVGALIELFAQSSRSAVGRFESAGKQGMKPEAFFNSSGGNEP